MGIDPEAVRVLVEYDWPGNVRELRNLVESMVVLAPGRVIRPEDIPPEVRFHRGGGRTLMPVPVPVVHQGKETNGHGAAGPPPELEFIFRTMFDMRMDLDDLRREFEIYKQRQREPVHLPGAVGIGGPFPAAALAWAPPPPPEPEPPEEKGVVVFRPGMTMQDLERQAINAALREARGNRRRAAEMLGIGERTLYRKLKEYQLEA
jgi:DNA-binding NtrC family response regulator